MIKERFLKRYFVIYRILLWQSLARSFYLFINIKKSYFLRTRKFMYICVYTHVYVYDTYTTCKIDLRYIHVIGAELHSTMCRH